MRIAEWKSIRVEGRFQKKIYINLSIIKMDLCQIKLFKISNAYILLCGVDWCDR